MSVCAVVLKELCAIAALEDESLRVEGTPRSIVTVTTDYLSTSTAVSDLMA